MGVFLVFLFVLHCGGSEGFSRSRAGSHTGSHSRVSRAKEEHIVAQTCSILLIVLLFLHLCLHTVVIEALPTSHCITVNIIIYLKRPSTRRVRLGRCRRSFHFWFTFAAYAEIHIQCTMHCSCVCVVSPDT